jgi:hypothetical protein
VTVFLSPALAEGFQRNNMKLLNIREDVLEKHNVLSKCKALLQLKSFPDMLTSFEFKTYSGS